MNPRTDRRSFLFAMGALSVAHGTPTNGSAQAIIANGFVLGSAEGEHLIHFRDRGNILVKISSDDLAVGTQQVMRGSGFPVHRHLHMEQALSALAGIGT